jgi:cold shock protein
MPRGLNGYGYCEVVQRNEGVWLYPPDQGGKDVFVHISAVERSGMRLAEGMKVSYEVEADRRTGKESATNLKAV